MRFTFSNSFKEETYNRLLVELGAILKEQRIALKCTVRSAMSNLHVGFGILKK